METKDVNRILFVGTGGGNDVFSAILAARSLQKIGWKWNECAFAGVLSPFHHHAVSETPIHGVYAVLPNSLRSVARKDKVFNIGFIDAVVSQLVQSSSLCDAGQVLGFSLVDGSDGLSHAFKALGETYDFIVLVDVGGDCFYRGAEDTHVLSPMFDAMVVRGFVDSGVSGMLFEAGPGTDGELEPEALEQVLTEIQAKQYTLHPKVIEEWEQLYEQWILPVRPGRTVPITIRAFKAQEEILTLTYRARAHFGAERLYYNFEHRIKASLCKKFYLIDPRRIKNPFAIKCSSPLDWFVKTQVMQQQTNCEANLEYVRHDGLLYQFLTPSPLFSENDRMRLLTRGLQDLQSGVCDRVWMFPGDWEVIAPSNLITASTTEHRGLLIIESV